MTNYEYWSLAIRAISALLVFSGLIYAGLQLRETRKQHDENHKWKRRHFTQEFLTDLSTGNLAKLRHKMELDFNVDMLDASQTYKSILNSITDDLQKREFQLSIRDLFNLFEGVCLGIKNNTLEEDICEDSICLIVSYFWKWGKEFIDSKRAINPAIWIEFEHFAKKWSGEVEKRAMVPRKPGANKI